MFPCISGRIHYKNLPRLCIGKVKSTWVSKFCSPRRGLPSRGRWKSLTRGVGFPVSVQSRGWLALTPHNKTPFLLSKTTSKRFKVRKRHQLWLIMTSRHCMIYDVARCHSRKPVFPKLGKDDLGKTALWIRPEILENSEVGENARLSFPSCLYLPRERQCRLSEHLVAS